ncbi:MAG: hydroxymethylbilane synthase [Alphaproteobacteria bacterium]|nr:hydroxymethylbilane synthase [Alphaproteobacteria bacterium]
MRIRIGSRRSALARAQTQHVIDLIKARNPDADCRIHLIQSGGDKDRVSEFHQFGVIGVFTKAIEESLVQNEVDMVVHSLKDLPTTLADGMALAAVPARADPRDVLCGQTLMALPPGARVGTGSLRRRAQILALRPDVKVEPIRGNVPPRLKLTKGANALDAVILAKAGLDRLDLGMEIAEALDPDVFPYAVSQGALGVEVRARDKELIGLLKLIEDPRARAECDAERAMLHALGAGCSLPVGVKVAWEGDTLTVSAQVTALDGSERILGTGRGPASDADAVGQACAAELRRKGGVKLLETSYRAYYHHFRLTQDGEARPPAE